MYEYNAQYMRNYDGDTATFLIDLGFRVFTEVRIRLDGIDTYEMNSDNKIEQLKAQAAQTFIENKLKNCKSIVVKTTMTKHGNMKKSFNRYIGKIYCDDEDLCELLLENDLAKPWRKS